MNSSFCSQRTLWPIIELLAQHLHASTEIYANRTVLQSGSRSDLRACQPFYQTQDEWLAIGLRQRSHDSQNHGGLLRLRWIIRPSFGLLLGNGLSESRLGPGFSVVVIGAV